MPHRGVEPRPTVSKTAMPPPHSRGDPFPPPEPTTGFAPASSCLQDRRLSQSSHVGIKRLAETSRNTSARSRTLLSGFGGHLLPRKHARKQVASSGDAARPEEATTENTEVHGKKQTRAEGKGVEPSSQRVRTALAVRPGQPYPATFQIQWGVSSRHEPTSCDCHLERSTVSSHRVD